MATETFSATTVLPQSTLQNAYIANHRKLSRSCYGRPVGLAAWPVHTKAELLSGTQLVQEGRKQEEGSEKRRSAHQAVFTVWFAVHLVRHMPKVLLGTAWQL